MQIISKIIAKILYSSLNPAQRNRLVTYMANLVSVDLLRLAYGNIGILNFDEETGGDGEQYILDEVVSKYIGHQKAVVFDVGANVGNYTKMLVGAFKGCSVYSMEPHPTTFGLLKNNVSQFSNANLFNIGLGATQGSLKLYLYNNSNSVNSHASLYSDVITDLHKSDKVESVDVKIDTLDNFCQEHQIQSIDFLKIDTEGHEYAVLQGAAAMLSAGKIKIIQFEFNEMNIISRVFLKDFYDILTSYNIYRINSNALIPLGAYSSSNEIFQFQNILAIHKSIDKHK